MQDLSVFLVEDETLISREAKPLRTAVCGAENGDQ